MTSDRDCQNFGFVVICEVDGENGLIYTQLGMVLAFFAFFVTGMLALSHCHPVCTPRTVVWPIPLAVGIVVLGRIADRSSAKRTEPAEPDGDPND